MGDEVRSWTAIRDGAVTEFQIPRLPQSRPELELPRFYRPLELGWHGPLHRLNINQPAFLSGALQFCNCNCTIPHDLHKLATCYGLNSSYLECCMLLLWFRVSPLAE